MKFPVFVVTALGGLATSASAQNIPAMTQAQVVPPPVPSGGLPCDANVIEERMKTLDDIVATCAAEVGVTPEYLNGFEFSPTIDQLMALQKSTNCKDLFTKQSTVMGSVMPPCMLTPDVSTTQYAAVTFDQAMASMRTRIELGGNNPTTLPNTADPIEPSGTEATGPNTVAPSPATPNTSTKISSIWPLAASLCMFMISILYA